MVWLLLLLGVGLLALLWFAALHSMNVLTMVLLVALLIVTRMLDIVARR